MLALAPYPLISAYLSFFVKIRKRDLLRYDLSLLESEGPQNQLTQSAGEGYTAFDNAAETFES